MPWERDDDGKVYKYQYHPHGDKNQPLRNAPSALNTVIVPNVTLPQVRISLPIGRCWGRVGSYDLTSIPTPSYLACMRAASRIDHVTD